MNRLELISKLTNGYNTIADIGTDHGYVCIEAVKKYGVSKAYACDVNQGPLNNALDNIKLNKLDDKIETILSDGLKNLNCPVEAVVIAGMGGELIAKILNDSIDKLNSYKALILEPNNEERVVREFLFNNNFIIKDEYIIKDHSHHYEIMVAIKGNCDYSENDILYGPILRKEKSPVFIEKYENKLNILLKNYQFANDNAKKEMDQKIKSLKEVLYNE